ENSAAETVLDKDNHKGRAGLEPDGKFNHTLTMHWNGQQWSRVPSPNENSYSDLFGVAAFASNDVWAVGRTLGYGQGIIMHWNGSTWTLLQEPLIFSPLVSISGASPSD